ncbi:MAG: hypothetical protein ACE5IY_09410 [bacterium]
MKELEAVMPPKGKDTRLDDSILSRFRQDDRSGLLIWDRLFVEI